MTKKSPYEEYEYDDAEDHLKGDRRNKREKELDKKKLWDRESYYDSDNDYDEQR